MKPLVVEVDNKRTVKSVRGVFEFDDSELLTWEPGLYEFKSSNTICFACPGCGRIGSVNVGKNEKPAIGPSWNWNGDENKPTLTPSINCVGCCQWHGYWTDGVFVTC